VISKKNDPIIAVESTVLLRAKAVIAIRKRAGNCALF